MHHLHCGALACLLFGCAKVSPNAPVSIKGSEDDPCVVDIITMSALDLQGREWDEELNPAWLLMIGAAGSSFKAENCVPEVLKPLLPDYLAGEVPKRSRLWFASSAERDFSYTYIKISGLRSGSEASALREAIASAEEIRYAKRVKGSGTGPPNTWPVHPTSPNYDGIAEGLQWWPLRMEWLGGTTDWLQSPAEFGPCANLNVGGMSVTSSLATVYIYIWRQQWFFPEGGCGA
jgi:hypothetical protein